MYYGERVTLVRDAGRKRSNIASRKPERRTIGINCKVADFHVRKARVIIVVRFYM